MDSDKMNSGVYCIRNITNGKLYIGSTADFNQRWRKHHYELRAGGHHSSTLQQDWTACGGVSFVYETLHRCAPQDLRDSEQRFLCKLKPAYNSHTIAGRNSTRPISRVSRPLAGVPGGMTDSKREAMSVRRAETARLNREIADYLANAFESDWEKAIAEDRRRT